MLRPLCLFTIFALANEVLGSPPLIIFRLETLRAHNDYRRFFDVPPLILDNDLNNQAQTRAEELANEDDWLRLKAQPFNSGQVGETIYVDYGPQKPKTVVDAWFSQISNYICGFPTPPNPEEVGAFTQLVWKASRRLGVGRAVSRSGYTFVVCRYDPAGNIRGRFIENVPCDNWENLSSKVGFALKPPRKP